MSSCKFQRIFRILLLLLLCLCACIIQWLSRKSIAWWLAKNEGKEKTTAKHRQCNSRKIHNRKNESSMIYSENISRSRTNIEYQMALILLHCFLEFEKIRENGSNMAIGQFREPVLFIFIIPVFSCIYFDLSFVDSRSDIKNQTHRQYWNHV